MFVINYPSSEHEHKFVVFVGAHFLAVGSVEVQAVGIATARFAVAVIPGCAPSCGAGITVFVSAGAADGSGDVVGGRHAAGCGF